MGEAFDPDGEFGAVAVEACQDYDEGDGLGGATPWWKVVVECYFFAIGGEAVGVRDGEFLRWALAEGETFLCGFLAFLPGVALFFGSRGWEAGDAIDC